MPDSIDKKPVAVKHIKVHRSLKNAIATEALRLSDIEQKQVSMGDVIQMAWSAYIAAQNRTNVRNAASTGQRNSISSCPDIELQESELPWVQRVAAILGSGNKVIADALHASVKAYALILESQPGEKVAGIPDALTGDTGDSLSARVARTAGASGDAAAGGAEHAGRITESLNGEKGSGTKVG